MSGLGPGPEAAQVATVIVAAVEGAVALSRARHTTEPPDRTEARRRRLIATAIGGGSTWTSMSPWLRNGWPTARSIAWPRVTHQGKFRPENLAATSVGGAGSRPPNGARRRVMPPVTGASGGGRPVYRAARSPFACAVRSAERKVSAGWAPETA